MQTDMEKQYVAIKALVALEDLAEKKLNIFSRLLMDVALAKQMETLAKRHEMRKQALLALLGERCKKEGDEE